MKLLICLLIDVKWLSQSFHKKGKRIRARSITNTSEVTKINILAKGIVAVFENTVPHIFINTSNWGIIIGNPNIAIIAAFCCAFAAIAARKVKTILKLHAPKKTIAIKTAACCTGKFRNKEKSNKLNPLIINIRIELNKSLARTNC